MNYINTVLNFLNDYSVIVLPVLFAIVLLYGIVNWIANPYRKQNKKLVACYKGVFSFPDKVAKYADKLPDDYRRQWRVVINCEVKPSLAFEFVTKRKNLRLLWLFILSAVVSATYIAVFFLIKKNFSYLVFQGVFWLAFTLMAIISHVVSSHQERRARIIFARLVTQLNRCVPIRSDTVEETVRQLQQLNRCMVDDTIIGRASDILRKKGLETNRTVGEQRLINNALNSLLQSYSRQALNN